MSHVTARRVADLRRTRLERILGRAAENPQTLQAALGRRDLETMREAAAALGETIGDFLRAAVRERVGRIRMARLRDAIRRRTR